MDVNRLRTAIRSRHSVRTYTGEPLSDEHAEEISRACSDPQVLNEGARVVPIFTSGSGIFTGLAIRNVPSFLVMVGDAVMPHAAAAVGYLGERVVLAATALGVSTCWVTATVRPSEAAKYVELRSGERVFAVSPLGYAGRAGMVENMYKSVTKSRTRKLLNEIVTADSVDRGEWPSWVDGGLEAARLAPSAYNRQPWRFQVGRDSVAVLMDTAAKDVPTAPRELDCGIAMSHLELGATATGVNGRWEFLAAPNIARYVVAAL